MRSTNAYCNLPTSLDPPTLRQNNTLVISLSEGGFMGFKGMKGSHAVDYIFIIEHC